MVKIFYFTPYCPSHSHVKTTSEHLTAYLCTEPSKLQEPMLASCVHCELSHTNPQSLSQPSGHTPPLQGFPFWAFSLKGPSTFTPTLAKTWATSGPDSGQNQSQNQTLLVNSQTAVCSLMLPSLLQPAQPREEMGLLLL